MPLRIEESLRVVYEKNGTFLDAVEQSTANIIKASPESGSLYYNQKKRNCIVSMAVQSRESAELPEGHVIVDDKFSEPKGPFQGQKVSRSL
ncbi:hypothetical protein J437_LFUL011962 [Ladona fulva]|uniref:Uncharacterized protein n=1 Tax=Ladona fulva TaxID=123851 RepID=A0A8K0P4P5_LADFU|nr:hypothetical protein J437_LFUL011962 [Ladona fulva]